MGKLVALAQVGLLVSVLGTGCSLVPIGGTETCVDWVRFETPQDQYDKSGVVLIGKSVGQAGETSIYGCKATTHLVEVEQVLKGDPGDGNLRISSMPQTCTGGESYPDGDPIDTAQRVIIFATKQGGEWFTMTPTQGVFPFQQGTELPFTSVSPARAHWTRIDPLAGQEPNLCRALVPVKSLVVVQRDSRSLKSFEFVRYLREDRAVPEIMEIQL